MEEHKKKALCVGPLAALFQVGLELETFLLLLEFWGYRHTAGVPDSSGSSLTT